MFWFIITGIIALVAVGIVVVAEMNDRHGSPLFAAVVGLALGGFMAFTFGVLLNMLGSAWTDTVWKHDGQADLLALQDNIGTSGSFFLGTGMVDEEASFFYYEKLERGAHLTDVDADDAVIIEEEGIDQPYVEVLKQHTTNNFWFADFLAKKHKWEFHIPRGSIVTNYSLDAN